MHYVKKKGWKMLVDIIKGEMLHCVEKQKIVKNSVLALVLSDNVHLNSIEGGYFRTMLETLALILSRIMCTLLGC